MKYKTNMVRILSFGIWNVPMIGIAIYLYANYKYYTNIEKYGKSFQSLEETYQYMITVVLVCLLIYVAHRLMSRIIITINEKTITTHQYGASYSLEIKKIKKAIYKPRIDRVWLLADSDGKEIYVPDGYLSKKDQHLMSNELLSILLHNDVNVELK